MSMTKISFEAFFLKSFTQLDSVEHDKNETFRE